MAPRAYWKGYLRLSLVSCPVALFPATSEREKVSFHQINKQTGNRVRYLKVDAETEDPVESSDIVKGYEVSKGHNLIVDDEEIEAVAIESKRTIDIDQFVPRDEIDQLYNVRPYYIAPNDEVGYQAFAVIREAISAEGMVALARVVLTTREHVIALEPRGKGIVGTLLRYPYEVRNADDYFDDIPDEKIPKDMLDLAKHIVHSKAGHFEPEKFAVTSRQRVAAFPDAPTFPELGYPDLVFSSWFGLAGPKGFPPEVAERINAEARALLRTPKMKELAEQEAADILDGGPAEFTRLIADDVARWSKAIREMDLKLE